MQPSKKTTPEQLELDMQIDMLVDNELPESERRALLEKCEKQSAYWRTLAVRFLERQTERATVRDLIAGKTQVNIYDAPPIYAFKLPFGLDMRTAAAVLLIAVGAGSMGMYYGQRNTASMIAANRPANTGPVINNASFGGGNSAVTVAPERHSVHFDGVPLSAENASSLDALIGGQSVSFGPNGPRNVIIVPQERNQAIVVPVSTDRTQVIY